jgi:hypothetical protein
VQPACLGQRDQVSIAERELPLASLAHVAEHPAPPFRRDYVQRQAVAVEIAAWLAHGAHLGYSEIVRHSPDFSPE